MYHTLTVGGSTSSNVIRAGIATALCTPDYFILKGPAPGEWFPLLVVSDIHIYSRVIPFFLTLVHTPPVRLHFL